MRNPGFHYIRRARGEGGVHAIEGPAPGRDLASLLHRGPPPLKVALEIIAAVCEILYFAQEDGEVHGDVHPRNIVIDADGAVSVQGFGRRLRETWAPERRIAGPATDRYGLGYAAYRLLAEHDLDDRAVTADAHEESVLNAVLDLPLSDLPEDWARDIQVQLARLLDYDVDDRPEPYQVWLSFVAFANDATGPSLAEWAPEALAGRGALRDLAAARAGSPDDETLDGPIVTVAGVGAGDISFRDPEPSGEISTRFFTRDELRSALGVADDDDGPGADDPYQPRAHENTAFFTRKAWLEGQSGGSAPRPVRAEGARPPTLPPPDVGDDDTDITEPGAPTPAPAQRSHGPAEPERHYARGERKAPEPAHKSGGGRRWLLAALGCGSLVLVFGCAGLSAATAFYVVLTARGGDPVALIVPVDEGAPAPQAPPPAVASAKAPASKTAPPAASSAGAAPATARASGGAASSSTKPPSAGTDRPTRVVFSSETAGTLTCDDGNTTSVDGRGSVTFRKLPAGGVRCEIKAGSRTLCAGTVQAGERKCACDAATGQLSCS